VNVNDVIEPVGLRCIFPEGAFTDVLFLEQDKEVAIPQRCKMPHIRDTPGAWRYNHVGIGYPGNPPCADIQNIEYQVKSIGPDIAREVFGDMADRVVADGIGVADGMLVSDELCSVKAAEPVVGCKPHKSLSVLDNIHHPAIWEAILLGNAVDGNITLGQKMSCAARDAEEQ
jgi:hypothetical protein